MRIKFIVMVFLLAGVSFGVSAASLTELDREYTGQLKKQSGVNSENIKWQSEKAQNEEKLREMIIQKVWLENRITRYRKYIASLQENIKELKRKQDELVRAAEELEPYLDEILARLETFIAVDIPFLSAERSGRIDFLRTSLADYRISAGEKLRRVLEALKVEADYVKGIEVSTEQISVDGETVTASLFRFGRLGYYYMTADRKSFGYYSLEQGAWIPLSEKYKSEIVKASEIAERKRMMELIYLPVSAKEVSYEK